MLKFLNRITNWETWPFYMIYAPLGFLWLYYAFKCGRFWFFSNVDPTLEFSGFEGDHKKTMYMQLPSNYYPSTVYIKPAEPLEGVLQKMNEAKLNFPVAAKPDAGTQGLLFRKINNKDELKLYHSKIPVDYLIQNLIQLPVETSVFYIRYPGWKKGIITGFIAKEYLHVTGDGASTLLELIRNHPKANFFEEEHRIKHKENLDTIIAAHEQYYLSFTGNHNRGATFINLKKEIDDELLTVFDEIGKKATEFYYGRYDIKTSSIADLKSGKNFCILEFNGAGAEPNHIYDCNMKYFDALNIIAEHWKHLYKIGRINRETGIKYLSFFEGLNLLVNAKKEYKILKEYDVLIPDF